MCMCLAVHALNGLAVFGLCRFCFTVVKAMALFVCGLIVFDVAFAATVVLCLDSSVI